MLAKPNILDLVVAAEGKEPLLLQSAVNLAKKLNLPYVGLDEAQQREWVLLQQADRIALRFPGASKPFSVDFARDEYARRLQAATLKREPLARAVGLKDKPGLSLIDGTAGWGSDAMLLAKLGAKVIALERSPIVAALLADGLRRAQSVYPGCDIQVQTIDTMEFCQQVEQHLELAPSVIYLDPMFPERSNSALVKKPLQLLQALLGAASDANELLLAALSVAERVVVKRPTWAEPLMRTPNFSVPGGLVRFDVYTTAI